MAPIYDFKAFDQVGKIKKGIVEAENARAARVKLKKQRLLATEIREKSAGRPSSSGSMPFSGRVKLADISLMTRQIASLVKANIPLVEALNALVDQTEKESLKVVLARVRDDVNEGSSLAKAMSAHPKIFDPIFINMVEAGESSGTLGLVLLRLADLKEAQARLRNKVISGMTYPLLMLVVSMGLMLAIFAFVIPKLTKVFESLDKPMPPTTQFLIWMSNFILDWWFAIIGAVFLFFWIFSRWKSGEKGRRKWDYTKLRLPIFGTLIRMIAITRFASTMSTLLGSGVPILTAMRIARNLVGNVLIAEAVDNARENITEGQSIADPLRKSGEFPPLVIHMIAIGERTGELPDMLDSVSTTYEDQVNGQIDRMTALMEPMMIVVMGFGIAFIIISVFMPLMDISNISTR